MIKQVPFVNDTLRKITDALNYIIKRLAQEDDVFTKTGTYSSSVEDGLVLCDATGGAFTVTLPDAALAERRPYIYKRMNAGANAVTVDGFSTQTIDGALTYSLASQYAVVTLRSDGSNWHII